MLLRWRLANGSHSIARTLERDLVGATNLNQAICKSVRATPGFHAIEGEGRLLLKISVYLSGIDTT